MKFAIFALATIALCEAKFPTGIAPCPGYENHPFQFLSGSIPEVFKFPGPVSVSFSANRKTDMPADMVMDFKIRKVSPYTYDVPCVDGTGSCAYEICQEKYFTEKVCSQYPEGHGCGCPFKAGQVDLNDITYTLRDLGALAPVMKGDYEGKALFYSKAKPDDVLGCVNYAFTIDA